jgi:hypothetical protein
MGNARCHSVQNLLYMLYILYILYVLYIFLSAVVNIKFEYTDLYFCVLLCISMELDVSHDEKNINLGCMRTVCQREYVELTGGGRSLAVCTSCQIL